MRYQLLERGGTRFAWDNHEEQMLIAEPFDVVWREVPFTIQMLVKQGFVNDLGQVNKLPKLSG